jgi:4-amino-4-deoxy-L-arabinose transferase-like glycosyltransferase
VLATLPWTVFALPALVEAGRSAIQRLRANSEPPPDPDDGLPSFLFVWTLVPIIFFSISRSKLPGYILPAIPATALLTADYLHRARAVSRLKIALHALVCAVLLVGALIAPFAMVKLPPPSWMGYSMAVTGGVIAFMVLLMVRREGVRVLHFVTLVPTILAVAFLLRPAAAVIDKTQSARPIAEELSRRVPADLPVATFNVKRDIAYGLNFYRNQPISHYEQEGPADLPAGIPAGRHIVVARKGSLGAVQAVAGDRSVMSIGEFPPRQLEFFLVDAAR